MGLSRTEHGCRPGMPSDPPGGGDMRGGGSAASQAHERGEAAPGPRPAAVRGNDWRQVALPAAEGFAPSLPVSVVVPYFEAPQALALTLAGLERQSYPARAVRGRHCR